ncbi:DNA polymerase III subunit gamma and tau [Micromonospora sp. WMMD812]|uniref:DNA polymerase III subunit gamma and tau n=1 Tax=Micromonospora sp. WMMD812 TaxID=3015152 RepID=UPI00248C9C4E|nr:DNA polymerase III subunit gamma and tau [Micromonospora sp. WMMD812]WBB65965.1 DNA polymerase III subunit gamma and tau [Micromonospora sp. WMMD812]
MALALYRKYRPRTFAEVIGQEHVTEPLSQALRSGRLNHAYLFSGPRGCGKTSSARILARSLNCEQGPTPEPCGQCESCRSLAPDGGGSIDVIEIDAASHGGVDDARELREKAFFAPARSRFKIYVIDEAHMVSSAGFNALLKLVEEPPEYVKFIFATTEPEKVLGTIKSRTHHYPFRLFPPKVLRPYLEQLCEAEGVKVEPAVFPLVVRAGGGSMRDSLSVLDQLIAGAGPEGVTYARAAALLGVTDSALIDEMCDALAAGDGAAAYATVDRVVEAGHDARRFASDLLERLRDLIVLQQVPDAAAKGLIDGPADQIERMAAQAQRLGPGTLSRCADIVHNGLVEMRGTTAPRLLLELISARMLLPGADDTTGGLLQRLERMERRLTLAGTDAPPATAGSAPATAAPAVRPAPPAPPAADAAPHPETAGTPAAAGAPSGRAAARAAANAGAPAGSAPGHAAASTPAGATAALDAGVGSAPSSAAGARAAGDAGVGSAAGATAARDAGVGSAPDAADLPRSGSASTGAPAAHGQDQTVPARRAVPPSAVMPDPATPEPPRPGAAPAGQLDAVAVRRVWPDIVAKVNRIKKPAAALMRDAVVRDVDGDTLVLTVKSPVLAQMMGNHTSVLAEALYEEFGGRWQIRCEVAGERGGAALPGPARPAAQARPAPSPAGPASTDGPGAAGGSGVSGGPSGAARPAGGTGRAGGSGAGARGSSAGRAGGSGAGAAPASADDEEDWPEPARPGGAASGSHDPAGASDAAGAGEAGDDWPEAARPGGVPAGGPADTGTAPGAGAGPAVRPGGPAGTPTTPTDPSRTGGSAGAPASGAGSTAPRQPAAPAGGAPVSSALAAARAAAAGRGGPRTGQPVRQTADSDWAGEPPYDPDYDGPVRPGGGRPAAPVYEGFDPGDEPLDDVIDEKTARESSEEQAVRLLREAFGAEKINEVDAR